MNIKELLNTLKDKNFRTSQAENPELVKMIEELEKIGLVRIMKSADDCSISVAITTEGFNKIAEPDEPNT